MAGVSNDVPDDAVMLGIPATGERDFKVKQAALAKLPELRKEFRRLRQVVEGLSEYVEQQRSRDEGTAEDYSPRDDSRDTDRAA